MDSMEKSFYVNKIDHNYWSELKWILLMRWEGRIEA